MTVGVGNDVAYAATPERPRAEQGWHARFIVAFGGGVVVVCLLLLASMWSDGLRGSTFEDLRGDLREGSVLEWYVADSVGKGTLDRFEAHQSSFAETTVTPDGTTVSNTTSMDGPGEPTGGIIVWRTFGSTGWNVAAAGVNALSAGGFGTEASDESAALVKQLREAGVSMRPFSFGDSSALDTIAAFGGFAVFAGLLFGAAPRVGTRWFWFWLLINGPLFIGFIAYAVMELIGIRRRPDPPLKKRLPGIASFVGAPVLGIVLGVGADYLRSRGVPLPL